MGSRIISKEVVLAESVCYYNIECFEGGSLVWQIYVYFMEAML